MKAMFADVIDKVVQEVLQFGESIIKIDGLKTKTNLSSVIKIQEEFIKGITDTIELYFDGQPAKAYTKFSEVIEFRKGKYKKILNINKFDLDENFYRIMS